VHAVLASILRIYTHAAFHSNSRHGRCGLPGS
jgi:hypothetical protein